MEDVVNQQDFWKGRKVFLTGHTGFKGSWLSLWLQHMGADVTGYSLNPPTNPSMFEVASVASGMTSIIDDIRDAEAVSLALKESQAEIVFHLAAQPLVRYSYSAPLETYETNVMGTAHVLEAVRLSETVRSCVVITSDKCYENREWVWGYREDEAMGGYDPYSSSKGCSELVVSAYRSSFCNSENFDEHKIAIGSGRAGNVIGGGDWAQDRLVPDLLKAFEEGKEAVIRKPNAIRPWQHVLEPLMGYIMLAERLFNDGSKFAEGWNFGPAEEDALPVGQITKKLSEFWGEKAAYKIEEQQADLHEANYLKLDCSKAHMKLDWKPHWTIKQALSAVVEWHKAYINNSDMRAMTIKQIDNYANSLDENN